MGARGGYAASISALICSTRYINFDNKISFSGENCKTLVNKIKNKKRMGPHYKIKKEERILNPHLPALVSGELSKPEQKCPQFL